MRTVLLLVLAVGSIASQLPAQRAPALRPEHRKTYWPNGQVKSAGTFLDDVRHGEYRTFREDGTPYELRHFDHGRESGVQQSWEADGTLFLNYEMRNGRRYGLVNAAPCLPAGTDGASQRGPS
jgi:hypothetical protein